MGKFKFIDLFAGIGGFHQAMTNLGGECVLASEIDKSAIDVYKENYGIDANHDITKLKSVDIPNFDVLCAGFPCQPFSIAGSRLGFFDQTKGTLFFEVARILRDKQPKYFILENVRNLVGHDNGNTFRVIMDTLKNLGYNTTHVILSPNQLGVPQLRERVYILGVRKDIYDGDLVFEIPQKTETNIETILEENDDSKYRISEHDEMVFNAWDEFHKGMKKSVYGFPIWAMEFKETYDTSSLPKWKADYIRKNRRLYEEHKEFIDEWLKKWNYLEDFTPTERKFEWHAGDSISSVWEGIIEKRASGVRVKTPNFFPTITAIGHPPVIGKLRRRLTPREAARLQSFPEDFVICENDQQAYKQFGNAVNVRCVEWLAKQLFEQGEMIR